MYCCKDFNSLSVLSLYEGELLGSVDKLYFDKKLKIIKNLHIFLLMFSQNTMKIFLIYVLIMK